jgi:hypothetical protein
MPKKPLALLAAGGAALALAVPASASAEEPPQPVLTYTTPVPGATPAEACANSDNVVILEVRLGDMTESVPLAEPGAMTGGGCVTTITKGELSTAAYVANCKVLEPMFAAEGGGRPYPYSFYGDPMLTANNRADCVQFLRMFHTSI